MPQISTQEFERLALRVHDFLAGVPLHDVWAVEYRHSLNVRLAGIMFTRNDDLLRAGKERH